ncbi:MAG: hypothetical protein Hyperionvirus5_100 [Hyperionvirus sp.]|uniref:Uncharacterized protein n=1 Tax=Hyperionvirus sp. TaxID=2487770 RepID=A0A3G5A9X8_9VIRU|nr:MAG: hypothetical protein Hyperionvirus5_100 [Hyperionvirus sp.]
MLHCICGVEHEEQKTSLCDACGRLIVHKKDIKWIHWGCEKCEPTKIYGYVCCECELMPKLVCNEVYLSIDMPGELCQIIGNFMEPVFVTWRMKCHEASCYQSSCLSHNIHCCACYKSICSRHGGVCHVCKNTFCHSCFRIHNYYPQCGFVGPICAEKNIKCHICSTKSNHHHIAYRKSHNICQTEAINVCCNHYGFFSAVAQDKISHTIEHDKCICEETVCPDNFVKCDICFRSRSAHKKINLSSACKLCEGKIIETDVCCDCLNVPISVNLNHIKICRICSNRICVDHFKRVWSHCIKCDIEENRSKFLFTDE